MATGPDTAAFLLDQIGGTPWRVRRMFGEYCLYRGDQVVALLCDDALFLKDTAAGRTAVVAMQAVDLAPPFPGAKDHLRITPDAWDDADWLRGVLDATANALPPARPKPPRGRPAKRTPPP